MVRSKFSFLIYFCVFLLISIVSFCTWVFIHPEKFEEEKLNAQNAYLIIAALLVGALLFICYFIFRFGIIVRINDASVVLKSFQFNRTIYRAEIKSINLFSRKNLYWFDYRPPVSIRITLEDGKEFTLLDNCYANIAKLKKALFENFAEKVNPPKSLRPAFQTQTTLETSFERFAGNAYTSGNAIIFYLASAIIVTITARENGHLTSTIIIVSILSLLAFYLGFGYQLYYFIVSEQRLIIKNHFLPWINRGYLLSDIFELHREKPYRRSYSLRVLSIKSKSRLFAAGSLRDKHWQQLREKMEGLNINFVEVR